MLFIPESAPAPGLLTVEDALTVALSAVRRVPGPRRFRCAAASAASPQPMSRLRCRCRPSTRARSTATASTEMISDLRQTELPSDGTTLAGDSLVVRPDRAKSSACSTGAPVPPEVDAIVMEEKARVVGRNVRFDPSGRDRPASGGGEEDVGAGSNIIEPGTVIDARHVAILTATGVNRMVVRRKIEVGILSTGSELVAAGRRSQSISPR